MLRGRRGCARADLVVAHRPVLERVVTSGNMTGLERPQERRLDVAVAWPHPRTTRMEDAGCRRIDRRGHVPAEDDPLAPEHALATRPRHRREERPGVRMPRMLVQLLG